MAVVPSKDPQKSKSTDHLEIFSSLGMAPQFGFDNNNTIFGITNLIKQLLQIIRLFKCVCLSYLAAHIYKLLFESRKSISNF